MTSTPKKPTTRAVVAVDDLTKHYGSIAAVDSLSFEVPAGQVTGLLGPNGAGKTTAMKMLLGLVKPTSGRATLLGAHHTSPEFIDAVRSVGALIESPANYEQLSARRNLELAARARHIPKDRAQIDELLDLVDLTDRADDRAGTYSFGMKQRLGIAVALVGRPELVILDEPANGLDPAGIVDVRNLLRRLPEMGTTVFVSSHQLSEVEQACDRLVVLNHGKVIQQGTTDEIVGAHHGREFTVRLDPADVAAAVGHFGQHAVPVVSETIDAVTVDLPPDWSGRDVNRILASAGIFATEIVHEAATLETAFLEMTGASNEG